jgi:hypothetical protein
MNYYKEVEGYYLSHRASFFFLEDWLEKDLKIPVNITRDTIKRILIEVISNNGSKRHFFKKKNPIFQFIVHYFLFFFFYLIKYFGKKSYDSFSSDVLFEEFGNGTFCAFYKGINDKIEGLSVKRVLFSINSDASFQEGYLDRSCHLNFSKDVGVLISSMQKKFFRELRLMSSKTSIDFFYLFWMLIRYVALYETQSSGIKCRFLLSSGDSYYNSLRAYIYRKNGIENIALIQNGLRGGRYINFSSDMYTHCDYYFGYGYKQIDIQSGMQCDYKMPIGSVRLHNETNLPASVKIDFNVVYVEGYSKIKDSHFDPEIYNKSVDNLCKFSAKHKQYRVLYVNKNSSRLAADSEDVKFYNKLDKKLFLAGIYSQNSSHSGTVYDAVLSSEVVVYYMTTVGIEALALGKKVLCCNYNKAEFLLSDKDELGVVVDDSYDAFEEKLLNLIKGIKKSDQYYNQKKFEFMNQHSDPNGVIADIINNDLFSYYGELDSL